jgi:type I restriction enzyme M protein
MFAPLRDGFYSLTVNEDKVRDTIYSDTEFSSYADNVEAAFVRWKTRVNKKLKGINDSTKPKLLIVEIAEVIIEEFKTVILLDKYDAYEVLLSYWNNTMADDVYLLVEEGYKAIRETENICKKTEKKKKDGTKETKTKVIGWEGKLIPKTLVVEMFFGEEKNAIDAVEAVVANKQVELDELLEIDEESEENEVPQDIAISVLKKEINAKNKVIKDLKAVLDKKVRDQYAKLKNAECLELLLERKWYSAITSGIYELYSAVNHRIADRVLELNERYEETLPVLESKVAELEGKVKTHLERMGFTW